MPSSRPRSLSNSRSRSGSKSRSKARPVPGQLLFRFAQALAWMAAFVFLIPAHLFARTIGRGYLIEAGIAVLLLIASFVCRHFAKRRQTAALTTPPSTAVSSPSEPSVQ